MYTTTLAAALRCRPMKQFTTATADVNFKIDDDEFHPPAEVPAGTWVELLKLTDQLDGADNARQFDVITSLFEMLLPEDDYKRFFARLHDKDKPIGLPMLIDVMEWLLGDAYGLRPTQPPSSSAGSSTKPRPGGRSTAGARPKVSRRSGSPQRAT